MSGELAGKTAFVTGGVSGVGFGIVQAFAAAGAKVVATYRTDSHMEEAKAFFAGQPDMDVQFVRLEVQDPDDFVRAADEAEALVGGPIDILVNNAGVNLFGAMEDATLSDWQWVMGVNFWGVVHGIRTFVPRMKARSRGYIVNVGSVASVLTGPDAGIYTASKFAVRGLTESLRMSVAKHGIVVSLMLPGLVKGRIHEAPLRRPQHQADTAFAPDPEQLKAIGDFHQLGMEPREAGEITLRGMLNNEMYIITHPDHRADYIHHFEQFLDAVPFGESDPRRDPIEQMLRDQRVETLGLAKRLTPLA